MIGNLGFSYIGLIFLLMLIIPNLIWIKKKPYDYDFKNENKILLIFERMGQVLVSCIVLIFEDFNLQKWSLWSFWLIAAIVFMIMYEYWWFRYFKSVRNPSTFTAAL